MRSGWLFLALVAMALGGVARAGTVSANLPVSAYVAPVTSVEAVGALDTVTLTSTDLALGYKDVSVRYRIRSNVARGYLLHFAARTGLTRSIEVRGLGAPVELGAFGAEVPQFGRPTRADGLDLQYRLHLTADARPGEYTMPVVLSANPL